MLDTQRPLAAHVLSTLAIARSEGVRVDLDELTSMIGVRRADVRAVLSQLHREGFVDVQRMQLTLAGFAVARALEGTLLRPVRRAQEHAGRRSVVAA